MEKPNCQTMQAVNQAAFLLLADISQADFKNTMVKSLGLIGRAANIDCINIWQINITESDLYAANAYSWHKISNTTSDVSSKKVKMPYASASDWIETFKQGKYICRFTSAMSIHEKECLGIKSAKTMLLIPMFIKQQLWGILNVDVYRIPHHFALEEVEALQLASAMFANAISRYLHIAEMEKTLEDLRHSYDTAKAATQAKSDFLANTSHEIRTPMNSILGFSELALDCDINDKVRNYLDNIRESANWLLNIINGILDISKIETDGMVELENIPFDLPELFERCQALFMPKVIEKGLLLSCHAEQPAGKKIIGDPVKLRQVLTNLLSNSVKFTNSGSVSLLASIESTEDNHVKMYFEISDTGIGMTPEQMIRIFEPYAQADASISRDFGGTGLGLVIIKSIIDVMGGIIHLESQMGIGTKFSFTLMFELADNNDIDVVAETFERPNFNGEVLVCEDNHLNQQVICEHLKKVGLKAIVANNGYEGLDMITSRMENNQPHFDLIFMDIYMPIMGGIEAAAKITALGINTPIVALTANASPHTLDIYKANGILDFLCKPFTSQELWKCLAKYVDTISYSTVNAGHHAVETQKILKRLRLNFVTDNQGICEKLKCALASGDIKTAHRLVHTIKSNAGQIDEKQLQMISASIENMLMKGQKQIAAQQLNQFESEVNMVLDKLTPLLIEANAKSIIKTTDKHKIWEIIKKLEPLLVTKNPACEDMIDDIRTIPNTENLIKQIENFKFKQALEALSNIKDGLAI